jgi:putative transposase
LLALATTPVSFTIRRLPHWQPPGKDLFLTWHLHGSLPRNRYPPPSVNSAGKAFVWMDRYLDQAQTGPHWLAQEEIAQLVENSLHYAEQVHNYIRVHAWVIMSNHVHLLVSPVVAPVKFLQSVKGYTAREANKILARTGEPFWQAESYDHWVRDAPEFGRIRAYIENNPVRAGLASSPSDYRWSSAYTGTTAVVAALTGRSTD